VNICDALVRLGYNYMRVVEPLSLRAYVISLFVIQLGTMLKFFRRFLCLRSGD